ncbi:hypothetical protein GCM10027517_07850 [Phycicoccus ginsengisoli]
MTLRLVGSTMVRTTRGVGDWTVWAVEQPGGVAGTARRRGLAEVVVADAPSSVENSPGFTAVACTRDGNVMVVTRDAPPALLVARSGCRTAPGEPGGRELVALERDELLLLVSSSVLEAQPAALSHALQSPAELVDRDPDQVLAELFAEVPYGAGAIIRRTGTPTETEESPE